VDKRFVNLFKRSFKNIDIRNYDSNLDYTDNDRHITLASLGFFLRQSINDFPKQPEAYIVPDPDKVNHFKSILPQNKKLKVGLSWSTSGIRSSTRNISLNQMAKFLTLQDVEYVNLQYGDTLEEREKFQADYGINILNFDNLDLMNDFEGLAALMASCDLIITISNITAHISGAIGKKTWVIVTLNTQWHWFHNRNDSLWYPNVKLFRQQQYGNWKDVIDKIYNEIINTINDRM
jgi:ADP-heptose:LPS heptosyltransferase